MEHKPLWQNVLQMLASADLRINTPRNRPPSEPRGYSLQHFHHPIRRALDSQRDVDLRVDGELIQDR